MEAIKKHLENQNFCWGNRVWKVARLIALAEGLEPFDIPVKHLNICGLYPKEIETTKDFVYHVEKVLEADLDYPIILDDEGYVMDGRHRVIKALLGKKETIKAVRFEVTPPCCYERKPNDD